MLLSGYKNNTTKLLLLLSEKGFGVFWRSCLQNITYEYELKVSALKNVLIIPFDLLRTPKNLNFQNLGFI